MNSYAYATPAPSPTGDIGNHIVPKLLIVFAGILVFCAVTIRLLARHVIRKFESPDILLVISLVFFLVHLYNVYQVAIYPGSGVHQWQYNAELAAGSHYSLKLGSILFGLTIVFLKTAILVDWMHLFIPTTRNVLYWILVGLIWCNGLFYFIGTIIEIFQCSPEDASTSKCKINLGNFTIASGIINVVSDLTILLAPHWVVWQLNMSTARKIGVSVMFLIGFLATGSAIARVVYVSKSFQTSDFAFYSVQVNLSAIAEQTFGYLVIGVPAIPKPLRGLSCAKWFGCLPRSRAIQHQNPSSYYRQGLEWPSSVPRRNRDPLEEGETDTHFLVPIVDGEREVVARPTLARLYGARERSNPPRVR
ncbi:hypothetical protein CHU98_g7963 [Xylaria longipes]|nr:hypothetical protein CHU98_g7963 [Xylaria longipes]